ncbi:MAG: CRISPR-associated protein Cmr3 [Blastocatellia bacterium]
MKTWIIEPHDSFIARDGRPFGLIAGVRAASLPFPFPSTTTGGVRTRAGLDAAGVFDAAKISEVKTFHVHGALLVELDDHGTVVRWFAHAPADALLLDADDRDTDKAKVCRLVPGELPDNAATNLPDGLMPLYLQSKDKPHGYAPRFWNWAAFEKWLFDPKNFKVKSLYDFGIRELPQDERSHVGIERDSQTSEQGHLFQTRGLEFTRRKQRFEDGSTQLDKAARLALAVSTDATNIETGVASLGGERRLITWRDFQGEENILDSQCPDAIVKAIVEDKACRVVVLTPAYFAQGWKPRWMTDDKAGIQGDLTVSLKAAAISRAQVVSGWDFEFVGKNDEGKVIRGRPKPTRRLVPAGAVFFLKFSGNEAGLKARIEEWIKATWMRCVSDDDEKWKMTPRRDGFGLAVLGRWPEGKEAN